MTYQTEVIKPDISHPGLIEGVSEGVICEDHGETHEIRELNLAGYADGGGISVRMAEPVQPSLDCS